MGTNGELGKPSFPESCFFHGVEVVEGGDGFSEVSQGFSATSRHHFNLIPVPSQPLLDRSLALIVSEGFQEEFRRQDFYHLILKPILVGFRSCFLDILQPPSEHFVIHKKNPRSGCV